MTSRYGDLAVVHCALKLWTLTLCSLQGAWHARLKEVITQIDSSFKDFFKDIGCVGEIVLDDEDTVSFLLLRSYACVIHKHLNLGITKDISKWGIQRRAQFRKGTKLSTMTAEEQSGGVSNTVVVNSCTEEVILIVALGSCRKNQSVQ